MSTHMSVATAIVDNLAIMSNMDPHVRPHQQKERRGFSLEGVSVRFEVCPHHDHMDAKMQSNFNTQVNFDIIFAFSC